MKICRYVMLDASSAGSASSRYALIEGENVVEISGPPWRAWSRGSRSARLAEVRLLAPVEPSKIVCIGRNQAALFHHRTGRSDRIAKIFATRGARRRTRTGHRPSLLAT